MNFVPCCCDVEECHDGGPPIPPYEYKLLTPTSFGSKCNNVINQSNSGSTQGATAVCCPCATAPPLANSQGVACVEAICGGTILDATLEEVCNMDLIAQGSPKPAIFTAQPYCPLPDEYCCPETCFKKVGTASASLITNVTTKATLRYEMAYIEVCVSHDYVDCGSGPELKWIVKSKMVFNYVLETITREKGIFNRSISSSDPCYKIADPSYNFSGITCDGFDTFDPIFDCSAIDQIQNDRCEWSEDFLETPESRLGNDRLNIWIASSGSFCFERIKFFNAQPEGVISFTDSDVPAGCTLQNCSTGNDCCGVAENCYGTEYCFDIELCEPCWCELGSMATRSTTIAIRNICSNDDPWYWPSPAFTWYFGCDGPPPPPGEPCNVLLSLGGCLPKYTPATNCCTYVVNTICAECGDYCPDQEPNLPFLPDDPGYFPYGFENGPFCNCITDVNCDYICTNLECDNLSGICYTQTVCTLITDPISGKTPASSCTSSIANPVFDESLPGQCTSQGSASVRCHPMGVGYVDDSICPGCGPVKFGGPLPRLVRDDTVAGCKINITDCEACPDLNDYWAEFSGTTFINHTSHTYSSTCYTSKVTMCVSSIPWSIDLTWVE